MTPEQWQQVRELLAEALELKPEDRQAFLDRTCSSDGVRREVETLLSSNDAVRSSFLASSALHVTLPPGTKLGDYEVKGLLGSGGMGEVYRARDTRLAREVAIKVLPSFLARDADRLRRFEQEARAAAALNHFNILAVFQMGTYEGAPYLVAELLEGGTLREQLLRGPAALRKAVDCGVQTARGLAAAHEKGIVHRDLKPENLFVTKDGRLKILDFGLAKLLPVRTTLDQSTATPREGTEPGVVMGTVGYMSPEQVRGEAADHRTDIFAFGAILYEMLTGKRAFQKPTSAETMSAILNEDPASISQMASAIPPALQRVVQRCLEKNPAQRFQSASDLGFALEALSDSGSLPIVDIAQTRRRNVYLVAGAALALAICILAVILYWRWPARTMAPTLTRLTWDSGLTTDPALSPDGKLLAYASDRSGEGQLDIYVQQVGGGEPLRLTNGPGDKHEPSFSPDGTIIAFRSEQDDGVYLVSTLGGSARRFEPGGHRPQFSPDGKWIAYSSVGDVGGPSLNIGGQARIYVAPSTGGPPRQIRADFVAAAYPTWTHDSGHLLFLGNPDNNKPPEETIDWWVTPLTEGPAIKTGALDATRGAKLTGGLQIYPWAPVAPAWQPDGKGLVFSARFGDSTNLWRIAISPRTWKVTGLPQRLTYGSALEENPAAAATSGEITRVAFSSASQTTQIYGLSIKANEAKVFGQPQLLTRNASGGTEPSLSRDGNRLAYVSLRPGDQEVWIEDLRTGKESALTATGSIKYSPIFSPDASIVSFAESPSWNVYVIPSAGGAPEMVCGGCGEVTSWSPDGRHIIGNSAGGKAWVLDVASRHKSDLLATSRWIATDSFAPDGRWFSFIDVGPTGMRAYVAPTSEQAVPESSWIAVMNGEAEAWSPDGNLFYATSYRDGHLCIWAQRVDSVTKRPVGPPFAVFHSHNTRLSLATATEFWLSVAGSRMAFSMGERTGNIWMAEWKD